MNPLFLPCCYLDYWVLHQRADLLPLKVADKLLVLTQRYQDDFTRTIDDTQFMITPPTLTDEIRSPDKTDRHL